MVTKMNKNKPERKSMRRDSPVLNALNLDERRVIEGTIIAIPKDTSVEDKLTEESTDELTKAAGGRPKSERQIVRTVMI